MELTQRLLEVPLLRIFFKKPEVLLIVFLLSFVKLEVETCENESCFHFSLDFFPFVSCLFFFRSNFSKKSVKKNTLDEFPGLVTKKS